ncbi:MAG: glycosyltransferase [Nitrososphaerales archaeon]
MQEFPKPRYPTIRKKVTDEEILFVARQLASAKEYKSNKVGFSGYGKTKEGDRVFLFADNLYDARIIDSIAEALREKGASVDILLTDVGADRQVDELDEISFFICRSGEAEGRERELRLEVVWAWELAERRGYDLLIQGSGGASAARIARHSGIPWPTVETFVSDTTLFPSEVNEAINRVAWDMIWNKGKGGRVHLTDPEGTDVAWTLWSEYYDRQNAYGFEKTPRFGHLFGHPISPLVEAQDDTGVIAGTTDHTGKPFPYIKLHLKDGAAYKIEGGGKYGNAWRDLLEETKDIQFPGRPRPGLFWLEEVAIGTHPKVFRPTNYLWRSSWMGMWERFRSGIIHMGLGTHLEDEAWARRNKKIYGHIHVHLMFPTYEITTREGEKIKVIDKGHLTALDHPLVREVASKYGDPDELLKELWIPGLPGINVEGDYNRDYANDPIPWIKKELGNYSFA